MANIEHVCRECKAEARVEKCCSASARERALSHPKKGLCFCSHYNNRRHHPSEHLTEMYPPLLSLEESLDSNSTSTKVQRFSFCTTPSPSAPHFPTTAPCNSRLNATPSPLPRLPAPKRLSPLLPHRLRRTWQDLIIRSTHYFASSNLPVTSP